MGGSDYSTAVPSGNISLNLSESEHAMVLGQGDILLSSGYSYVVATIRRLEHKNVRIKTIRRGISLSAAVGLYPATQLVITLPIVKTDQQWTPGEVGLLLRWKPGYYTKKNTAFFLSSGLIIPKDVSADRGINTNSLLDNRENLHRISFDRWWQLKNNYILGTQLLLDIPYAARYKYYERVVQFSIFQRDERFRTQRLIPSFQMTYRYDYSLTEENAGWFVFGNANMEVQMTPTMAGNITWGGPLMVGIKGTQLSQSTLAIGLRWYPQ